MPTSRSEDPCNLVLLAMQHFTLTRPPFVIRKSTSLVNAGDSLALAPNCFRIEDCHWETVQSGCKMSSSNPFLLLLSVVSSKPGKEICKCFSAFSDAKKDMSKFTKNGTIKWDQGTSACHHQCPWFWLMLWINPRVNQNRCESINQFHQNLIRAACNIQFNHWFICGLPNEHHGDFVTCTIWRDDSLDIYLQFLR